MKYQHPRYKSEIEVLKEVVGISGLKTEKIDKPFHHKERVRRYSGTNIAKKYRSSHPRSVNKTYREANAHVDLEKIGVNVPKLFGILHSDEECSLCIQYIESDPLTSLLISLDPTLNLHLFAAGMELGKMFDSGFLHGDLTSYHILANGKTYLFDLEATRIFPRDEFYKRLAKEWMRFINSKQGGRWDIPFSKEQEETIFEGVQKTLKDKKAIKILENIVTN